MGLVGEEFAGLRLGGPFLLLAYRTNDIGDEAMTRRCPITSEDFHERSPDGQQVMQAV